MGRVDPTVQTLVRAVLQSVVSQDAATFESSLAGIADAHQEPALRLVLAIDAFVLRDLHGGEPNGAQIAAMAQSFREMEDWYQAGKLPVEDFLSGLVRPEEASDLKADESVLCAYLVGGWLLAAYLPQDKAWWQYLNEVLDSLDGEPRRQGAAEEGDG